MESFMKQLETKEVFYQTDDVDGQIYLHDTDVTGECGKALLTVLVEERTSKPIASPIDVKDLIFELADLLGYYRQYEKSSYDTEAEVGRGIDLILNRVKSGVLHEKV